ncbi:sugar-binding protein [Puniceicoccus vermicola]|uniref:Carbohydrate-binding domain-containing protein n=1 Tax=Puniceicoccus vermicola TaxID=388746 RepID=A0A7X1E532_9BACT|nr:sugar-binding protein [Puniceicoccus vermicola]MBC2602704.1 hypothetical protein [Puniceicoccus vermicola]
MSSDGEIKILAEGKVLTTVFLPFSFRNTETGEKQWVDPVRDYPKEYFSRKDRTFEHVEDVLKTTKTLHVGDGEELTLSTSLELLPDGLISLSYKWDAPPEPYKLIPRTAILSVPFFEIEGTSIQLDGTDYPITSTSDGTVAKSKDFVRLKVYPESPSGSFTLLGTNDSGSLTAEVRAGQNELWFRIREAPETHCIRFLIDIREGAELKNSSQLAGGIDFLSTDDLVMPDYAGSRNLLLNPSFEQGLYSYDLLQRTKLPQEWGVLPFKLNDQDSWDASYSLELAAPESTSKDFRFIGMPMRTMAIPLSPGRYTFSVYAKSSGSAQLSIWFPNSAWVGNRKTSLPINWQSWKEAGAQKVFQLSRDWTRYSLTFEVPQSMPVFAAFGSDSPDGQSQVWIDGLQLERGSETSPYTTRPVAGRFRTSQEGNFLEPSDPLDASLEVVGPPETAGTARISVKDFFGQTLVQDEFEFSSDQKGHARIPLSWNERFPSGIFVVKASYELANGTKSYDLHRFAIMDFLENKHRLKGHFSDEYGDDLSERFDFLTLLDRYRKIGIGGKPHTYRWDEKAVWDAYTDAGFMTMDSVMSQRIAPYTGVHKKVEGFAFLNESKVNGLRPDDPRILLSDFNHDANGEITPEWLQQFKDTVATLAAEHPWVPIWSLGNEVYANYPVEWWSEDGDPEKAFRKYAILQQAFIQGVKQGNPEAQVYQGAPSNMNPNGGIAETAHTLAELNEIGSTKFDWIGIHNYRKSPESPDLDADAQTFFDMLAENGYGDTPVFWPEGMHYGPYTIPQWGIRSASWLPPSCWYYGTLSYDMGWSEKVSAAWRARSWLVSLKYQDKVKTFTSSSYINNLDMDIEYTPFATQKISNTLGNLLGDAEFREDIRFASYLRCYIFEDAQERPVAAIWCHHPKLDAGMMSAPAVEANFTPGQNVKIFDLMEAPREFNPDPQGRFTFPVSSFPVFFLGEPGTLKSFIKTFKQASVISGEGVSPLQLSARPMAKDRFEISATNLLSRDFVGTMTTGSKMVKLTVPSSSRAKAVLPLPTPLQNDLIVEEHIPVNLNSEKLSMDLDLSFRAFLSEFHPDPIVIDGKLEDWSDLPKIPFSGRLLRNADKISDLDLSGHFQIAWNTHGIFIAVSVEDDLLAIKNWPNAEDRWDNDSLQIYFDTLIDARSHQQQGFDENDYDYTVHPSSDGNSAEVFRRRSPDPQLTLATTAPPDNMIAEDIPAAFQRTREGYTYEIYFPAKYLLPLRLEHGSSFGFSLTLNDKDAPDGPIQSSMTILRDGQDSYNRPDLWPAVLLWNKD